MLDLFRREPHGGVLWMGTAKNEEEGRETVRKFHAVNPGIYFAFDQSTQTTRIFKPGELDETNLGK